MNSIEYSNRFSEFFDNVNSNYFGISISLFIHLFILLFAIGLPDFFKPKPIALPNIIPIEIINVSETTSIAKKTNNENKEPVEKKLVKQKKFNASENVEIKKMEIQKNPEIIKKEEPDMVIKKEIQIKEKVNKNNLNIEKNEPIKSKENIKSINKAKIKPKLKPDLQVQSIVEPKTDIRINPKPQIKPEPDFSIASMLKDLRNEKSNNQITDLDEEKDKIEISESKENDEENITLSISEIDLLRQQLSSCWNAPAGAVIEKGMKVRISSKVEQNKRVVENSVRIIDTNISKTNPFYGPITESAMRTLLNPECKPLKLPEDKYNLWKNLTITFDYSIMKGYSE